MPSWFSKVFKTDEASSAPGKPNVDASRSYSLRSASPAAAAAPKEHAPKLRRIVEPTVVMDESQSRQSDGRIRIKGQLEKDGSSCVFMVDRVLLEGHSAWFPTRQAASDAPLAQAIFDVEGVETVLIHGMNVTVERDPVQRGDWEDWAKAIGAKIRAHLEAGQPVVTEEFLATMPSEDEIREKLQRVIETEINPGISLHSGAISLESVEGNTVYIRMLGGCQGCAASTITLRQGIHQAFREAVPRLGAILDQTDHASGKNPFYRAMPAGMSADA